MSDEPSSELIESLLEHIESSYFLYKICEGCDKVLLYERPVCPNCNAYRFETSRSAVKAALIALIKEIKDDVNILEELF
jgi:hypothetical protein